MSVKLKHSFQFLVLGLFLAVWFSVLMPWDKLPDPDAFYHATMAQLTWSQGPVTSFPWLDLTTLGSHFADQHYLFHVLESPFVHFLGLTQGSRVSSLLFAVLSLMGITIIFYKLRLRPFWLWPLLLALSNPFSTRMVLGKASPLVVLLWLIGLAVALTPPTPLKQEEGRHILTSKTQNPLLFKRGQGELGLILLVSFLFTLTHGGWIILPGSILILFFGQVVYFKAIENLRLSESIKSANWSALVASALGVAVGFLLHPGRSELLSLLWIQVIKIGLVTPQNLLPMGTEWAAASPGALLAITSVFGIILLLIVPGLIFARLSFRPEERRRWSGEIPYPIVELRDSSTTSLKASGDFARNDNMEVRFYIYLIISWSFLIAVLVALTLKSARFSEYLQPALAIWVAALAQLVDWKKLFGWLNMGEGKLAKVIMPLIVGIALLAVLTQSVLNGYTVLHRKPEFMDDQYLSATEAISDQAQAGDRVYHSQWDEFPVLFSRDQRLRYVAGLDPNFFYEASSTLALDYFDLSLKAASSAQDQAWSLIHDKLGAKFALIDTIRWPDLAKILDSDQRYQKIGQGQGGVAYRLIVPSF
ncbi:MAG: hypothetical protein WC766_03075 [Patescibacteria group bacterium]|jgi:hypothetical protein